MSKNFTLPHASRLYRIVRAAIEEVAAEHTVDYTAEYFGLTKDELIKFCRWQGYEWTDRPEGAAYEDLEEMMNVFFPKHDKVRGSIPSPDEIAEGVKKIQEERKANGHNVNSGKGSISHYEGNVGLPPVPHHKLSFSGRRGTRGSND